MGARVYSGGAVASTLSSAITSGATSIAVTDASTWPLTGAFTIVIDRGLTGEEKILVGSRSGNTLTVTTRGYDGTAAAAHTDLAVVEHVATAVDFQEANDHVNLPVDVAAGNIHHTLGYGALQAAPGNSAFAYSINAAPPIPTLVGGGSVFTESSTGTASSEKVPVRYRMLTGATSSSRQFLILPPTTGSLAAFTATNIDVTLRGRLSLGGGNAGAFYFGVTDGFTPPTSAGNGGYFKLDTATGIITSLKRAASVSTASGTLATVTAGAHMTLRLSYPVAGGTATLYLNGTSIGTVATVPSLGTLISSAWYAMFAMLENAAAADINMDIFQILITES